MTVPRLAAGCTSVWAQYTIRLPEGTDRDGFAAALKAQGIPTAIYYPKSMHQQTAYRDFPVADGGLPVSERLSDDVISLPMHAYLDEPTQERIIKAVRGALFRFAAGKRSSEVMPVRVKKTRKTVVAVSMPPNMLLKAAHARTHLHRRRLHPAFAADRIRAGHHARGDPGRGADGGRIFRGAPSAQSFSRDFCRRRLQRGVRTGLCACPRRTGRGVGPPVLQPYLHAAVCHATHPACRAWLFMPQAIGILAPGFTDDPDSGGWRSN